MHLVFFVCFMVRCFAQTFHTIIPPAVVENEFGKHEYWMESLEQSSTNAKLSS